MPVIEIDSLADHRLSPYRDLKQSNLLRDQRLFIVEGTKVVERLLASPYCVHSILLSDHRRTDWEQRVSAETSVFVVPLALGEQLVGFNFHVGVLACGVRPERTGDTTVVDRIRQAVSPAQPHPLVIACPHCDNPENLGAIIRIGRGLGATALLVGESSSDPYSRRVVRVSMGAIFSFPVYECRNLLEVLTQLRSNGTFRLAGSVLSDSATPLNQIQSRSARTLMLGNEATGLTPEFTGICDELITIPMSAGADSLNVAVAAGIMIHHLVVATR